MQEDIQCAGSDTRPPMLDRTDFESWQQRIRLWDTVSDVNYLVGTEGCVQQGPGYTKGHILFINHFMTPKDFWENIEMILAVSGVNKDDMESQFLDDFETLPFKSRRRHSRYYVRLQALYKIEKTSDDHVQDAA
ncbi:hypothetical protein Tco_1440761 [Tanacetum coccineum]